MRLLTKKQVRDKVTISPSQMKRLEDEGKFPLRIQLGQNRVAWCEAEIDGWIKARIEARDKPTP